MTDAKKIYHALTPINGVALQHQIGNFLRELIVRGDLVPDERIPNVRDLAQIWKTSHYTVQAGITPLVEEGLVVRRPRLGTFVARAVHSLEHAGIYCDHVPHLGADDAFANTITTAVFQRLAREGASIQAWFDTRSDGERITPWPALAEAVAMRQVQAIAVTCTSRHSLPWLQRLGVPIAVITTATSTTIAGVYTDDEYMASLAAERLAALGCRRVGLLCHLPSQGLEAPGGPFADTRLYHGFWRQAHRLGLEVCPEWIVHPESWRHGMEQRGYELFKQLWSLPERPDGLLVFPDNLARGVFHAMLEARVKVPRDLRLVVHRNREIDVFSPFPVDWVTVSVQAMAEGIVTQLHRQLRGKPVAAMLIKPALEIGS